VGGVLGRSVLVAPIWPSPSCAQARAIIRSHGYQKSTKTDPPWANWVRTRLSSERPGGAHCRNGPTLAELRQNRRQTPGENDMQTYRARPLDATKILTRRELAAVLNDLKRKAPRSKNTRLNLALFRLACCCGLRDRQTPCRRRANGTGASAHSDSQRRGKGRTVAGRSALVGRRDAGRSRRLENGTPFPGRRNRRPLPRLTDPRSRRQDVLPPHAAQALPHGVQSPRGCSARNAYHSSWASHIHQSCASRPADIGRGQRRRGACQRQHHVGLFARHGGR
jgi:hypothetical protein